MDRLSPVRHHFAIAGTVPYLGYFREKDALAEEKVLRAQGLDTFVGEVSGYSTLGITSDPVFSSMLEGSPAHIVEVTLHEMLHGTLYLAGHSEWNESLATFVGLRGAALFFAMTGGPGGGEKAARRVFEEAALRQKQSEKFSRFLKPFLAELDALYKGPLPRDEKLRRREGIFQRIREQFLVTFPTPKGKNPPAFARAPLNNAVLAVHAVYHGAAPDHARILALLHGDLAAFIRLYKHAVNDTDRPLDYLKNWKKPRS
jgi:predicted aminopeptidase